MVRAHFSDNGAPNAITGDAEYAEQTIEEPYRAGGVQPIVVEVVAKVEDDVVPAANDDKHGEEDV